MLLSISVDCTFSLGCSVELCLGLTYKGDWVTTWRGQYHWKDSLMSLTGPFEMRGTAYCARPHVPRDRAAEDGGTETMPVGVQRWGHPLAGRKWKYMLEFVVGGFVIWVLHSHKSWLARERGKQLGPLVWPCDKWVPSSRQITEPKKTQLKQVFHCVNTAQFIDPLLMTVWAVSSLELLGTF